MSEYCINIPDELFGEILQITGGNRELTKDIWALLKSETSRQLFGLKENMSGMEVLERLNEISDLNDMLGNESFSRFVAKSENVDNEYFDSYSIAKNRQSDILSKYGNVIPVIRSVNGLLKIDVLPKDKSSLTIYARQESLEQLNTKLINYIEKLGFAVKEVDNLGNPGTFCPSDAETNANGLKEAIRVAKGYEGQQAIPEEVSHLLVEGFQNNPFMLRLMNLMTDDVVKEILGEQYDQYYEDYNGNKEYLAKEAVGRLVAQHLVDRSGISEQIRFISGKMLDKMRSNLKNGSESDIDGFLKELEDNVKYFVESTFGDEASIELFDSNAVNESKIRLDRLEARTISLQDLAEKSYNVTAKRMKIISLKNKDMKLTKDELAEFDRLKSLMEQKDYANACISFVKYSLDDCKEVIERLESIRESSKKGNLTKYYELATAARILKQAQDIVKAYESPMQSLAAIESIDEILNQIPQELIDEIQLIASEVTKALAGIKSIAYDMRMNVLMKVLHTYWGEDKVITLSNGDKKQITLQEILESCQGETFGLARFLNSMADMGDPFLQLMDTMYKDFTNKRDYKIFELQQRLANALKEYTEASGSKDTKVLFVRDENGKFTGMLKSDIDFLLFYREKSQYRKELKSKGMSLEEIKRELKIWDLNHTELVNVAPVGMQERFERMPKKDMYHSDDLRDLTDAQRQLYNKIIEIKKQLDYLLPSKYTHLYRAPMKKASVADQALSGGSIKGMWNRIKSRYIQDVPGYKEDESNQRQNETEFGEETQSDQSTEYGEAVQIDQYKDGKHVVLDFSGKEVRKIPVFYTKWLDDMSALDTNLIDSMLSYGAMAYNYEAMNDVSDFMELGNEQMQERNIILKQGARKLYERFKLGDTAFQNDYVIPGSKSTNANVLRQYIDRNVYGLRKNKESIIIRGKEVNVGNISDWLKQYNSLVGLGFNVFSGTTNLTMGVALTLIQCAGHRYFRLKNILNANKEYGKYVIDGIIGQYQDVKKDKLNLLIQRFDCLEEYYNELESNDFYGGIYKKLAGKFNPMILNSIGEHYLHSISMLAILDKKQVKFGQDGELVSLLSVLEPKEVSIKGIDGKEEKIYKIEIPENLLNEDGSKFTEGDMLELKRMIQDVNHKMHGAYNDVDKGEINKLAIGRLLMQFRQWMPAFYTQRFQRERINVVTGEVEEGFYRTYANFAIGVITDAFKLKFNVLTRFRNLTDSLKANVRMALLESGLAWGLILLLKLKSMAPDKDDPAYVNILKYNLYRLKMELGAAAPTSLEFYDNAKALIRTPLPAAENLDRLTDLIDLTLIGSEIKSGRYEGWNKYVRNLYFATPTAKNIGRVIDLIDGDVSMFNPYINKK